MNKTYPKNPEIESLKARIQVLEERLDLMTSPGPRCGCGKPATRTITADHPFFGLNQASLCGSCKPTGYFAHVLDDTPSDRVTAS